MNLGETHTHPTFVPDLEEFSHGMVNSLNDLFSSGFDVDEFVEWTKSSDPKIRRNREQFIVVLPALVPLVTSGTDHSADIEHVVDIGEPLIPALAEILEVSEEAIRFFVLKPISELCVGKIRDEVRIIKVVNALTSLSRPRSESEFEELWELADALGAGYSDAANHVLRDLCKKGISNGKTSALKVTNGHLRRLGDLNDYFNFVEQWIAGLVINYCPAGALYTDIASVFLSRYSFNSLWHQSEHWHRRIGHISSRNREELFASITWPALLVSPFTWEDLSVTSITSASDLLEEGRDLNHCAGTYINDCLTGRSHLLSIRDREGRRISTAEIKLQGGNSGVVQVILKQHRASANNEPTENAKQAILNTVNWLENPQGQRHLLSLFQRVSTVETMCVGGNKLWSAFLPETTQDIMRQILNNYDHVIQVLNRCRQNIY